MSNNNNWKRERGRQQPIVGHGLAAQLSRWLGLKLGGHLALTVH